MSDKDKIIIDKVIYGKYLYQKAITELSIGTNLAASVAILLFFDAVEMVVLALEDKLGIDNKDINLRNRIEKIKKKLEPKILPLERQILEINAARRNFKHGAQLQNIDNIKSLAIYAFDFMNQVSDELLELDFENISLATLIIDKKVKGFIEEAERCIKEKKYYDSITNSAKAYTYFFFNMKSDKPSKSFFKHSNIWRVHNTDLNSVLGDIHAQNIENSFSELYHFAYLSTKGIDIQKYEKFDFLRPSIGTTYYGEFKINHVRSEENNKDNSFENAQFCLDFVLDVILKLQRNNEE
ncbi:MAG: hypothetical protein GWP19_12430 [Planctomycetia bacterium]|nr:hypothetical protein [Planctomycetia bacterium]